MNLKEMLSRAVKSDKSQDAPGTVEAYLEELCPVCGKKMKLMKPCCGSPNGLKQCQCGYKVQL